VAASLGAAVPKGRDIETYYSAELTAAMSGLRSDLSILSDLQPYLRYYVDQPDLNAFANGTYFGHVLQQMFYVYLYRTMMIVCKVLDTSPDSWGFAGCYKQLGPGSVVARELPFLRARSGIGLFEVTPAGDPELKRWMERDVVKRAKERFVSTASKTASFGVEFNQIISLDSYKRVRVFRSEKIAHAVTESRDRKKYSSTAPVSDPAVTCVLEVSDAVIDFAENFFGHFSNVWPGFRERQWATKEYFNDFFKQLQFQGRM